MKTTEHLFYLIKSLSKAEKRSFKLFAKQYSKEGQNNYTLVFDHIDRMDRYNHQELIVKLTGKLNTKNLSTLKVQLNELILKSLRQNSASYSQSLKLRQQIDYVDILFEKGLYVQAYKLLEKAFEMARKQGDYLALDRLSVLEFNIALKQSNKEGLDHYINVTFPEVSEARKTNDMLAEFENLAVKMRLCLLESSSIGGNITEKRFQGIIDHPLMNINIDEYPVHCQYDYHIIWGHYHYACDHAEEMYFHRKRAVAILEELAYEKRIWLTHARFLLIGLSTFKMFKEFDEELKHIMATINAIPQHKRNSSFSEELEHTLNNIRVNRDLDEGNYSKLSAHLPELEEKYKNPDLNIDTNLRMVFYFNFAYTKIGSGKYKEALHWTNEILNNAEMRSIRSDLQCYIRIMQICIHYSLRNFELIRPLVKSAQRFLKKQNRNIEITMSFLKFANNHFIEPFTETKINIFDEAASHMRELSKDEEGKIALEYFEFVSWFEASYSGQSMEDVVKNKA